MSTTEPIRISILLPAINETDSLRETVRRIEKTNAADVSEYLVVVCKKTTPACRAVAQELADAMPGRVRVFEQRLPFLGGAMRDAFGEVTGTHLIMMASDLETDPDTVPLMVAEARLHPDAIITATRWAKGMGFSGYNPVKLVLNKLFQSMMAGLYFVRLTDMTYGYRLFPAPLMKSILWEELKHPFLLETVLKPLRLGTRVIEVPSAWRARTEGESQNTFLANFVYLRIALKTRFKRRESILKSST